MGEGVSFVSNRKVSMEGREGQETTYAFRDVTQLKLNEKPEAPSMPGLQASSSGSGSETTFRFSRLPNGHSQLTAVFSPHPSKKNSPEDSTQTPSNKVTKAPTAEQLEQAKRFFAGFRIAMAVEVQGKLVKTSSVYQEGTKVTLL